LISTPTITDPAQLEAAYQRTEQLIEEAAEAEHAAFLRWQEAYGVYEVACDDAAIARANWEQALIH
jgi:hypothetical protein